MGGDGLWGGSSRVGVRCYGNEAVLGGAMGLWVATGRWLGGGWAVAGGGSLTDAGAMWGGISRKM